MFYLCWIISANAIVAHIFTNVVNTIIKLSFGYGVYTPWKWWFAKIGVPPYHPFYFVFSIINHLFLGTTIYETPQMMILQTVYELGFTTTVKSTIFSWPFPSSAKEPSVSCGWHMEKVNDAHGCVVSGNWPKLYDMALCEYITIYIYIYGNLLQIWWLIMTFLYVRIFFPIEIVVLEGIPQFSGTAVCTNESG